MTGVQTCALPISDGNLPFCASAESGATARDIPSVTSEAALKETPKILMVAKAGILRRRGSAVAYEGYILG